jgi:hypothetical protein
VRRRRILQAAPLFEKYGEPEEVSRRFLACVARNLGGEFGSVA